MIRHHRPRGSHALLAITSLLLFTGVSCAPALPTLIPTLDVPPVVATLPPSLTPSFTSTFTVTPTSTETTTFTITPTVTITPTFTLTSTISRTPTLTPTPAPPMVSILVHAACNFGPGDAYLYKYGINATAWMEVIGQIQDDSWLLIDEPYIPKKNPCWIRTGQVRFNDGGDVTTHNLPVVDPDKILWFSTTRLYRPPQGVTSIRVGSKVNVYWNAVRMTEDDFYGYLIEAWVCQGGQQVFRTYNPYPYETVRQNVGLQSMQIPDEPGCSEPSHARIYTQEKHGVTGYVNIPWPDYRDPTATPNRIPTP